jgi:DNA-binding NarL/FixJ family response regulator
MSVLLVEAPQDRPAPIRRVSEDTISVVIVAKDPILIAGVERQLLAMPDVTLLTRTDAAVRHADIVLVVADTVDDEILGWIRTVRRFCLSRIVVVAAVSGQAVEWATSAGANGVLHRAMADGRRLAWAIQKVHRGQAVAFLGTDERRATLPGDSGRLGVERSTATTMSDRDREVLRLLAEGCDTGEIARTLAYSEPTIKNVIQRLFEQLKAKNRPHAVALALRSGII